jgi:hypothetical protein
VPSKRTRRGFLAALGAVGIAGCSNDGEREPTSTLTPAAVPGTGTTTPTATETPEEPVDFFEGRTSVARLRTVPRTYSLLAAQYGTDDDAHVSLSFVETATSDHPLTVRGTLENGAPWANTFELDEVPPFGDAGRAGVRAREGDRGASGGHETEGTQLLFVPTGDTAHATRTPDVERAADGTWRLAGSLDGSWYPETRRLDDGETLTAEWHLVGSPDGVDAGRPTGRYEFGYGDSRLAVAVWNTGRPGPETRSRFAGASPPALPGDGEAAWFHEATPESAVFLRPETERASVPAEFEFELVNHDAEPLAGNPYAWTLYKRAGDEWNRIAPWLVPVPLSAVLPGDTHEYSVRAYHGNPVPTEDDATGGALGHLGGGTYALEASFSHPERARRHAALFDLVGPAVTVEPTADATVDRSPDRITVTRPPWGDERGSPDASMRVERVEEAGGSRPDRIIPEQVYRPPFRVLRDVVPHLGDGKPVVVRTDEARVERFVGYEAGGRAFRWAGKTYRARKR